jgi:hypothetical protein
MGAVLLVLAAVLAIPAVSAAVPTTTVVPSDYVGSTAQGLPVTMETSATSVTDFSFYWRARCSDHKIHANGIDAGGATIDANGKFSLSGVLNTGGHFRIQGKIAADRASGTLSRHGKTAFGVNCRIPTVHWRAFPLG